MKDISLYIPGNSFFHQCDARIKLFMLMAYSCLSFLFFTIYVPLFLLLIACLCCWLAIGKKFFSHFLTKMVLIMMFFLIVLHGFVNPSGVTPALFFGHYLKLPFFGYYTLEGFYLGVVFWLRLSAIIIIAELFVSTTSPSELVNGLNKLGIPYNFCFMISMSLQLIPIAMREATIINSAQRARGLPEKTIVDRFKGLLPMFVPLVVSSLERMERQSMALECRGFGYQERPTDLSNIRLRKSDYIIVILLLVLLVAGIVCRIKFGSLNMAAYLQSWADVFAIRL